MRQEDGSSYHQEVSKERNRRLAWSTGAERPEVRLQDAAVAGWDAQRSRGSRGGDFLLRRRWGGSRTVLMGA